MNTINPEIDQTKVTVLIVDDIPLNVMLIEKMLGQYQFRKLSANSGEAALDIVSKEHPDLILLDLMMPGIDGYEVISRLRADDKSKDTPIIVLSALNSNDDIQKAMRLGANEFITKPVVMDKLLSHVSNYINKTVNH